MSTEVRMGKHLIGVQRCPHCGIARPTMVNKWDEETTGHARPVKRRWAAYLCTNCGDVVTAMGDPTNSSRTAIAVFPDLASADIEIPSKARSFLQQAMESLHAPALAIMGAASCVDAMLKEKGYSEGSLYSRINQAKDDHLITEDMATWAHEVRLDANDQRHAEEDASEPDADDAKRVIDFAAALAEILFVLPARVTRGMADASGQKTS